MASSSSSFCLDQTPPKKYDVFLSFRGVDTRNNFTSHLYSAFSQNNIETFIDDKLIRGDEISQSLLNAIKESEIAVVIFSEGYAFSRWCLKELVKILKCKEKYGQIVIPIFYHIDPSDVRNQTGNFGIAFSKLEERFKDKVQKLQKWRNALREAANLSGFDSHVIRSESVLVQKIVESILRRLNDMDFPIELDKDLVGVESRIKDIESLLRYGSERVYTLGIWGIGGIGKTTIARAIFNKFSSHFDGFCFLENVREEYEKNDGLPQLQRKLLSTLLRDENLKIEISNMRYHFRRLSRRKVLIIFDDVTHVDQIEFLVYKLDWFMLGSLIIITTRDKQILQNCGVESIYEMKELENGDALKLFSWYAFKKDHPNIGYKELSDMVLQYAQGVPLALKVLGRFLFGRSKGEWNSEIEKLKRIPHKDIQKVLKISYDGLDDKIQNIFLDIACFLKGVDRDFAIQFFNVCGFYAEIGISVLVDKCLVIISDNKISMHDLLQEMGREIIRQESVDDPGKRSRLCHAEDILEVLMYNTGTKAIQGISLDMSKVEEISFNFNNLKKMRNLRFLKFYGENKCKIFDFQDEGYIFPKLSYLQWHGYPLKSLPVHGKDLVLLTLYNSKVEQLWDGVQNLVNLKEINLNGSKQLTKLPDLSKAQNLEKLWLNGCSSLIETHSSIEYLNKLVTLDLSDCKSLKSLPRCIRLESLANLYVSGTAIKELPSSIVSTKISYLDVEDCRIPELPETLGQLFSLQVLCLDKNYFERIPESIINLPELKRLSLRYCERLQSLPNLPCSLQYMDAAHCTSLEVSSCLSTLKLTTLYKYIVESFHLSNCYKLDWEKRDYGINFVFPGSEIGEWFKHQSMGSSVTVKLRPVDWNVFRRKLVGYAFCFIVALDEHPIYYIDHKGDFRLRYEMKVKTEDGDWNFAWQDSVGTFGGLNLGIRHFVDSEHVVLGYHVFSKLLRLFSRKFGSINEFSLQFYLRKHLDDQYVDCCERVRKCGINLVYAQELEESMEDNSADEEEEEEEEEEWHLTSP